MWFDDATIYQIYPLGLCGAPLQNDGSDQTGEHRILRVLDWVEHIKKSVSYTHLTLPTT